MNWWLWMIVFWVIVIVVGVLFTWWWDCTDSEGVGVAGWVITGALAFGALIFSIMATVTAVQRHTTADKCMAWGIANNRPTKFVSYTWWSFTCVTPDGHGHWIPTSQIIVNIPKNEKPQEEAK